MEPISDKPKNEFVRNTDGDDTTTTVEHGPSKFLADLTKATHEYVGELNHYYESIIACMPNAVYWLDRNCILQGGNDTLVKLFGLKSRVELIGLTFEQMAELANWTDGQGEFFKQTALEIMTTGIPQFNIDEPPFMIEGKMRYYLSSKVPLYDKKGEIIGMVGVSVDITERKLRKEREKLAWIQATEEKAQALKAETELRRAVTVLTGSIAHDLRMPIAMIAMKIDLIQQYLPALIMAYRQAKKADFVLENIPEKRLNLLEELGQNIKEISQEMHGLIDMTLKTLSKGLKGDLSQEDQTDCSMRHCIHSTLARFHFVDNQRELVQWDNKDFNFRGNELLMVRVFSNLLNNSFQQIATTKRGEIIISTEQEDNCNIIRFKDTAGGAAPEVIDHLFEGYHTTKSKGTGVGLAFCKITMQSFGGDIKCHSVEGDSIEFILTFPKLA